jgi:DNA-binding response OmpR family regulator
MNENKSGTHAKILVIDDEKDILKSLKDTLTSENFDAHTATTGKQGIRLASEVKPDLIVLDLRLPDMDGYDVCRQLKASPETAAIPVIMLSTRSKDTEKVVGLEIGADDYLTKPYNEMELLARIRVALRRKTASVAPKLGASKESVLKHGCVEVDEESRLVKVSSQVVTLTKKEFDLLVFLMKKPGKALNRNSLLSAVWGNSFDSLQGTVDSHIKTLRKKLGDGGSYIETLPGIGYRWSEDE